MSSTDPFAEFIGRLRAPLAAVHPRDAVFIRNLVQVLITEQHDRRPRTGEWPLSPREPLRVQMLMRQLVMSENTLRDRVHRLYALRPGTLVTQATLSLAADLLVCYPDYPVKQICRRVGLQDDSHFARLFRRHYGVSPRAYRLRQSKPLAVSSS